MIDLHVHSTFSDGSLTPGELVAKGLDAGLTAMALTDHDGTGGLDQFLSACDEEINGRKLIGVAGVEISVDVARGTMHILGYFVNHKDFGLEESLKKIREGRKIRNGKILQKLNDLGFALTWDEVASFAGEDVVGRPHFAQAMISKGYVSSSEKAFDLYLKRGKPGYADRFRLSPEDGIKAIRGARGVAVLAHPSTLDLDSRALRSYTAKLREIGLQGIEAYYPEHSQAHVREYTALAADFDLVMTGGSDFHGSANPNMRLGVGFGSLSVPDNVVDKLLRKREQAL